MAQTHSILKSIYPMTNTAKQIEKSDKEGFTTKIVYLTFLVIKSHNFNLTAVILGTLLHLAAKSGQFTNLNFFRNASFSDIFLFFHIGNQSNEMAEK